MLKTHIRKIGAIVLLSVMPMLAHAADESLEKAAALIKANKYSAAYDLLEPLESDRAGDPNFDYLFGVAAVQNGKATRGVFALERVLAVQPNNSNARAFIARAYFQLGEKDIAKSEFQHTLDQHPSAEIAKAINDYMGAIDKSLGLVTTYNAYIEATTGHDSNINGATSYGSFSIPGGTITLNSPSFLEKSDNFMMVNAGASFRTPVAKNLDVFASGSTMQRVNLHEQDFDTGSYDANVGLRYKKGIDTYSVALQDSNYYFDSQRFRHSYGASGQWQRDLNAANQVNLFAQAAKLVYPDQSDRDANRYVVGGGWAHVFAGDKSPVIFLSGYVGKEDTKHSGISDDIYGNNLYGTRLGSQMALTPKWIAFSNAGYEYRDYNGDTPIFLKTRQDDQYDLGVGLRYLGKVWTVKPQVTYLHNDSNLAINDYDRTVFSVSFRHDFNW
ncbi:MAG: surface lipoprotein assembly modifier [Methylophilaceae bacterium]